MFNISQTRCRPAGVAAVSFQAFVQGSKVTINGEEFDFSFMPAGSTLPVSAIDSGYFAADVTCDADGVVGIHLMVPIGPNASVEEWNPGVLAGKKYGMAIDVQIPAIELPVFEEITKVAAHED